MGPSRRGRFAAGVFTVPGVMLAACLGLADRAAAQAAPASFPDDWFYSGAERSPALKALEGKSSPGLVAASWIGEAVAPRDMRGQVVVIDFWATWCGPCLRAIPENVRLVNEHRDDGLVFIGVHDANNGWASAAQVASQRGINYPLALDASGSESTAARFGVSFFPTYVVIDRRGIVRAAGLMPNRVADVVKALLAEGDADRSGGAAGSDFSPDHFYGGTSRPASLRAVEGRPAAALRGSEWFGQAPPALDGGEGVSVLFFFAPGSAMSGVEIDKVAGIAKTLAPAGARLIGVCDGGAGRETLAAFIESRKLEFPVLLDDAPAGFGGDGAATSAGAAAPEGAASAGASTSSTSTTSESAAATPPFTNGATASAFGARFLPVTVVVDGSGTVRAAGVRADRLRTVLEQVIREQDPDALARIPAEPAPEADSKPEPETEAPPAPEGGTP